MRHTSPRSGIAGTCLRVFFVVCLVLGLSSVKPMAAEAVTTCAVQVSGASSITNNVTRIGWSYGHAIVTGCDAVSGVLDFESYNAAGGYYGNLVIADRIDGRYELWLEGSTLYIGAPWQAGMLVLGTINTTGAVQLTYDLRTGTASGITAGGSFSYDFPGGTTTYAYDNEVTKFFSAGEAHALVDFNALIAGPTEPPPDGGGGGFLNIDFSGMLSALNDIKNAILGLAADIFGPIVSALMAVKEAIEGIVEQVTDALAALFWDDAIPGELATWIGSKSTVPPLSWFVEILLFAESAIPNLQSGSAGCVPLPLADSFCVYSVIDNLPAVVGFIAVAVNVWAVVIQLYLLRSTWHSVRH
jgi:hypothetical protein